VLKPEGKRQLGRPRCRWEDNIQMDHREVEWGVSGEGSCGHDNESSGSVKYWEILQLLSDWQLFRKVSSPWN
jgi:hypothetical protein